MLRQILCGCVHLRWRHQRVQKGQQHQQALHLLRARQRLTVVPDVFTYNGALCVCKVGQQHQQALRLYGQYSAMP